MSACRHCGIELEGDRYKSCEPCRENETERRAKYRALLYRLVRPNPWKAEAACRDMDTADFYPMRGQQTHDRYTLLRPLCDRCPVRVECLEDALYYESFDHDTVGFRGGKSAKERRALLQARARGRAGQVFSDLRVETA